MHTIEHIISLLRQFGAPGLFGLALIDSAGVPTGGAPDWMLVLLLSEHSALSDLGYRHYDRLADWRSSE